MAARIESTANAMSVSSMTATVGQNWGGAFFRKGNLDSLFDFLDFVFRQERRTGLAQQNGFAGGIDGITGGVLFLSFKNQVPDGNVNQIAAAQELHPRPAQQETRRSDRHESKSECAHQSVGQSPGTLVGGESLGQETEYQGVVDRQHALQQNQQANYRQISPGNLLTIEH
jgi:hypothetical protein